METDGSFQGLSVKYCSEGLSDVRIKTLRVCEHTCRHKKQKLKLTNIFKLPSKPMFTMSSSIASVLLYEIMVQDNGNT